MLAHTFCHVPGIGEVTECRLWSMDITSWDLAVQHPSFRPSWTPYIQESILHYEKRNAGFFYENLPSRQQWRLYWDFRDACAFVDIETTGLDSWVDEITTIVLYDGRSYRCYVNGDNLDEFPRDVNAYALLVTFNGKTFDVPFINRKFGACLPQAHIDLKYPLSSLGIKGGLKSCEGQLGLARPEELEGVDGFEAIRLWNKWRMRGNVKALKKLLDYNIQDTLSLHSLMVHIHNQKIKAMPFSDRYLLPNPLLPKAPFQPDRNTVEPVRVRNIC